MSSWNDQQIFVKKLTIQNCSSNQQKTKDATQNANSNYK